MLFNNIGKKCNEHYFSYESKFSFKYFCNKNERRKEAKVLRLYFSILKRTILSENLILGVFFFVCKNTILVTLRDRICLRADLFLNINKNMLKNVIFNYLYSLNHF